MSLWVRFGAVALIAGLLAPPARCGDASAEDLKKLQGTWQLVLIGGKKPHPADEFKLIFWGKHITFLNGAAGKPEPFRLDATKTPKQFDMSYTDEDKKERLVLGIYALKGDTLKWLRGSASPSVRPKDFDAEAKEVVTLKRIAAAAEPVAQVVQQLGGTVEVDLKQPGKPIVGVDLSRTALQGEHLEVVIEHFKVLNKLKGVRRLNLGDNFSVGDEEMVALKGLIGLQELYLAGTGVTSKGLKELRPLKELQRLDLSRPDDRLRKRFNSNLEEEVKEIKGFKALRYLNLGGTKAANEDLTELATLKALEELRLSGTQVDDTGAKTLNKYPALLFLDLSRTDLTDRGVKELQGLKKLEQLDVAGTKATGQGVKSFAELVRLSLRDAQPSDAGLQEIKQLRKLRDLDISPSFNWLLSGQLTEKGLKHLRELKGLQRLHASGAPVTDTVLGDLEKLKELQDLNLSLCPVTDAGLDSLKGLNRLRLLNLSAKVTSSSETGFSSRTGRTRVTDAGLKKLQDLTGLRGLYLTGNPLTGEGLKELQGLRELQGLDLGETKVSDATLKNLRVFKALEWVDLHDTQVTDKGLAELKGCPALNWLNLSGTKITDGGGNDLASLKGLRLLLIRSTKVTDAGEKKLQKALPKLKIQR